MGHDGSQVSFATFMNTSSSVVTEMPYVSTPNDTLSASSFANSSGNAGEAVSGSWNDNSAPTSLNS